MNPLYGRISEQTAYLVEDYPYGRMTRCRIRYWVEYREKKGFRFVSQTENPKTLLWNKPKTSTYFLVALNLYLDENSHVQYRCLSEYSESEEVLQFVKDFPHTDKTELKAWCILKLAYVRSCISGKAYFEVNGTPKPWTETDIEKFKQDENNYSEAMKLLA